MGRVLGGEVLVPQFLSQERGADPIEAAALGAQQMSVHFFGQCDCDIGPVCLSEECFEVGCEI